MDNGASSYRRFLSGDEDAFDSIIQEYRSGLTFFINRIVCDAHEAEDIAADVFAYVLAYPEKYNFKVSLKTYLYMLAKSRAIDALRRKKRRVALLDENFKSDEDIEKSVLDNDEKRRLYEAINTLDEDMKAAVYLVYIEGFSYKEAAKLLRLSTKRVDNLLTRAKTKLRTLLKI